MTSQDPAQPPEPPRPDAPIPPAWPPPPPPQPAGKTSGYAIASFVFGLFGGVLLSVVFGIVALRRIRSRGEQGRGFAVAGLALSGVWTVLIALAVVLIAEADSRCTRSVDAAAAAAPRADEVEVFYFHPTEASWEMDDREVLCVALLGQPRRGEL